MSDKLGKTHTYRTRFIQSYLPHKNYINNPGNGNDQA